MRIIITVETGNEAFIDHPAGEVARILRDLACQFEVLGLHRLVVRDSNGNAVGLVELEGEEEGE
jgi:hypothetical protein